MLYQTRREKNQSADGGIILDDPINRQGKNAYFYKSPTRTIRTQSNHLFALLIAYGKLE